MGGWRSPRATIPGQAQPTPDRSDCRPVARCRPTCCIVRMCMANRYVRLMTVGGFIVALLACGESAGPAETTAPPTEPLSASQRQLVGTWSLASIERRSADDQPLAEPIDDRLGYLIYDASGYMGVTIMRPDRALYSEDGPTADEALAQFRELHVVLRTIHGRRRRGSRHAPRRGEPRPARRGVGLQALLYPCRGSPDPSAPGES